MRSIQARVGALMRKAGGRATVEAVDQPNGWAMDILRRGGLARLLFMLAKDGPRTALARHKQRGRGIPGSNDHHRDRSSWCGDSRSDMAASLQQSSRGRRPAMNDSGISCLLGRRRSRRTPARVTACAEARSIHQQFVRSHPPIRLADARERRQLRCTGAAGRMAGSLQARVPAGPRVQRDTIPMQL